MPVSNSLTFIPPALSSSASIACLSMIPRGNHIPNSQASRAIAFRGSDSRVVISFFGHIIALAGINAIAFLEADVSST